MDDLELYTKLGWVFFPVNGKLPKIVNWPQAAQNGPGWVSAHWGHVPPRGVVENATGGRTGDLTPSHNVGVCTGKRSDVLVLDIDPRHDGEETLHELEATLGPLPETPQVITGGGGTHYYFRRPRTDTPIRNSAGKLGPGVDVRCDGGYVVAPPSIHPDTGRAYFWDVGTHPEDCELAHLPLAWLQAVMSDAATRAEPIDTVLPDGQRNDAMVSIAGTLRRRGLGTDEILACLERVNERCIPPLSDKELRKIAESVARYEPGDSVFAEHIELTDHGNALRMLRQFRDRACYVPQAKVWWQWSGNVWQPNSPGYGLRLATDTMDQFRKDIDLLADDEVTKRWRKHYTACKSTTSLKRLEELARSLEQFEVSEDRFDGDPSVLNTQSCVLYLHDWTQSEHAPDLLLTRMVGASFDETAQCPKWQEFVHWLFLGDEGMIDYIQRLVGHALLAGNPAQVFPILWGSGNNGKSTFLTVLAKLFGDYHKVIGRGTLVQPKSIDPDKPRADLVRLRGARLAVCTEYGEDPMDETMIKAMTGGDKITCRGLHKNAYHEFEPHFMPLISVNNRPVIRGTDKGIWRRAQLIPFGNEVSDAERDPKLTEKLVAEIDGILLWSLEGLHRYREIGGLVPPEKVRAAIADYQSDADDLGAFLATETLRSPGGSIERTELFAAYARCAMKNQGKRYTRQTLYADMDSRGYERKRVHGVDHIGGIEWSPSAKWRDAV